MLDDAEPLVVPVRADLTRFRREMADVGRIGQQFARSLTGAFEAVVLRGQKLDGVLRGLALSLSRMALRAAFKPLESALGAAFNGLFSGLAPFAKGGLLARGMPVPFAHGGVIAAPVSFPLADGRLGLAGEQGAEAILPLARGPDGRLGVRAEGGGRAISIAFHVSTPDVDGFRRSETQIAAMLARAVSRGQRNL